MRLVPPSHVKKLYFTNDSTGVSREVFSREVNGSNNTQFFDTRIISNCNRNKRENISSQIMYKNMKKKNNE